MYNHIVRSGCEVLNKNAEIQSHFNRQRAPPGKDVREALMRTAAAMTMELRDREAKKEEREYQHRIDAADRE